jgi:hypothetical protein
MALRDPALAGLAFAPAVFAAAAAALLLFWAARNRRPARAATAPQAAA